MTIAVLFQPITATHGQTYPAATAYSYKLNTVRWISIAAQLDCRRNDINIWQ